MRIERRERLVKQQHARISRERPGQRDPLPLAARQLARTCLREVGDAEALEQLGDTLLAAESHIPLDAQVREEGVLLEDEPDATLVRRTADVLVEPDLVVERDPTAGPSQPGDRTQDRALARPRRPDERNGALELEREPQLERAKRKLEVCREGCHVSTSLRMTSSAALTTTSRAPIANAVSKSTPNSW